MYKFVLKEYCVSFFQLSLLSDSLAACPRLKVLRAQENCLPVKAFTPAILRDSNISLLAIEGNLFEMKPFYDMEGYDAVSLRLMLMSLF